MEAKKIKDYIIIEDYYIDKIRVRVLEKLNKGYVLVGGVSRSGGLLTQTMIKYEN